MENTTYFGLFALYKIVSKYAESILMLIFFYCLRLGRNNSGLVEYI